MRTDRRDDQERARASYGFPKTVRLSGSRQFRAVFKGRARTAVGPLVIWGVPNGLEHARLGLSVSRRVGIAVRRNTIKRRLREAFRLMQHDWPRGYDVLIVVQPHEPLRLDEYQLLLARAGRDLHRKWIQRTEQHEAGF